jgi:hypothetical protein
MTLKIPCPTILLTAFIKLPTCMNKKMSLQFQTVRETLAANITNMRRVYDNGISADLSQKTFYCPKYM